MRRVCARSVHKRVAVKTCKNLLERFSTEGDNCLRNNIACDETWFSQE